MKAAAAQGCAFVAPDGRDGSWSHDNSPSSDRDETAFVSALLDDLDRRYGFGPDRVVVGGFSQGASMAFHVVCHLGDRVAGAVTFAGVFWAPLPAPADCAGTPPAMVHFHGRNDTVFPLAGRPIGERWRQGGTRESLAVLSERAGCSLAAGPPITVAGLTCAVSAGCERGGIALCLHDGGHEVRAEWLDAGLAALDRLSHAD